MIDHQKVILTMMIEMTDEEHAAQGVDPGVREDQGVQEKGLEVLVGQGNSHISCLIIVITYYKIVECIIFHQYLEQLEMKALFLDFYLSMHNLLGGGFCLFVEMEILKFML